MIWDLSRRQGRSFVIVTHNTELASSADRVLKLFDGLLTEIKI